jgi:hypothetical protein
VAISRFLERSVRQVYGLLKQGLVDFIAHARIVIQGQGSGYSYFPSIGIVHGATVDASRANKNVRERQL